MTRSSPADLAQGGSLGSLSLRVAGAVAQALETQAVRDTASMLIQEHVQRGRRGLALCSPIYGAGVSFLAASLGLALAQAGVSVLILDANLRRPSLQDLILPSSDEPGLLQYLRGERDDPAALAAPTEIPGLSLIYAGGVEPQAHDLFDGPRFERLIGHSMRTFGLVLVDAPPSSRCAETRAIASACGYAAIVARRNRTAAEDIGTLVAELRISRVGMIGTIFNEG